MEGIDKQFHISFMGSNDDSGRSFISLNFAIDMLSRNYRTVYTTCDGDREKQKFFKYIKPGKEKNSININKTRIDNFDIISFSEEFESRYSDKLDQVLSSLEKQPDFFIHNINNPLSSPYNRILTRSEIWIIIVKIEPASVSDYFNLIKKLMMLENHPSEVFVVFDHSKDIERAFELYKKILKESGEFGIGITPVFLGIIPNDHLRHAHSIELGIPLSMLFPESIVSGAVSFMADKIIRTLEKSINKKASRHFPEITIHQ